MVSGQHIQLFPGTTVQSGGHLQTLITDPCIFPVIPGPQIALNSGSTASFDKKSFPDMNAAMVEIYPNPTTGLIYLRFKYSSVLEAGEVVIYSTLGKIIKKMWIDNVTRSANIDLTGNPPGLYLMKFSLVGGGVVYEKIVVQ